MITGQMASDSGRYGISHDWKWNWSKLLQLH